MEADLKALEDKLTQFVEINQKLRDDTQRLRQELRRCRSSCGATATAVMPRV